MQLTKKLLKKTLKEYFGPVQDEDNASLPRLVAQPGY
jgi:hypothetical protein